MIPLTFVFRPLSLCQYSFGSMFFPFVCASSIFPACQPTPWSAAAGYHTAVLQHFSRKRNVLERGSGISLAPGREPDSVPSFLPLLSPKNSCPRTFVLFFSAVGICLGYTKLPTTVTPIPVGPPVSSPGRPSCPSPFLRFFRLDFPSSLPHHGHNRRPRLLLAKILQTRSLRIAPPQFFSVIRFIAYVSVDFFVLYSDGSIAPPYNQ